MHHLPQKNDIAKHFLTKGLPVAVTSLVMLGSQTSAKALQFNFSYQPGTSFQQIAATELAGNIWSSYLTDNDVTVNLHIEMTNGLGANRLGGATPAIQKINYDKFIEGLQADGTADTDLLATYEHQDDLFSLLQQDGQVSHTEYELNLTTANNKALGNDISGDASGLDGYIQMDQSASWHYYYGSESMNAHRYDFTSVMLHEIGHSLGFISGIDTLNSTPLPTALDMFRYSSESAALGAVDYRIGGETYFSIDGGETAFSAPGTDTEARFSTGMNTALGGDGDQASHWQFGHDPALGIMSAKVDSGEYRTVSALDLTAFDYIGWEVDHDAEINLDNLRWDSYAKAWDVLQDYNHGQTDAIQDRSSDVAQMMEQSGIYNLGFSNGIYDMGFSQWWQTDAERSPQEVPEPSFLFAILGISLFGLYNRSQTKTKAITIEA